MVVKTWKSLKEETDHAILDWAETQAWAQAMAQCAQDKEWHAEGDVWTHTRMVADALVRLDEWPRFTREEQLVLLLAALFHDSGKPATTAVDPETGHTISPNHSKEGMVIARRALFQLDAPLALREMVAMLVRFHGRPQHLLGKPSAEAEVIKLSYLVRHRLLYWLAIADTRGRIVREAGRPEEVLGLWRIVCEEQNCWGQPYPFANDHARFLFYRDALSSLTYAPYSQFRCVMSLLSGLPASGKDTWAARHSEGRPIVSLDAIREENRISPEENQGPVAQAAREMARVHLRAGRDLIINATNVTRDARRRWVDLAWDYGARVEIVYIDAPLEEILRRNRSRPEQIPERVLMRLADKLEPPTLAECHMLKVVSPQEEKSAVLKPCGT